MKRLLLTIVALVAITLSAAAQGLQDIQSDIRLCIRKDGKKAWYSFNGGVHFMGLYDQSITQSEKKIIDKEKKKKKNSSLNNSARNAKVNNNPFLDY